DGRGGRGRDAAGTLVERRSRLSTRPASAVVSELTRGLVNRPVTARATPVGTGGESGTDECGSGAGRSPGPRHGTRVLGRHLLATATAHGACRRVRPAGLVQQPGRWAGIRRLPTVAPSDDRREDLEELPALVRQQVLVPPRPVLVRPATNHRVALELVKPSRQDVRRHAEIPAQVLEAVQAGEEIAQDQRRPSFADDVDGPRHGARHVGQGASSHGHTVVHCFLQRTTPSVASVTTLVPDFCAAAGRHDVDAMLDTLAPGATLTSPLVGGAVFSGSADLKLLLGAVYGALRDLRWDEPIGVGRRRL